MRTNRQQNIEQVAHIVCDYIVQARAFGEDEDVDVFAKAVNTSTGWSYNVQYDTQYYSGSSWHTRVEGMVLSDEDLAEAVRQARQLLAAEV